MFIYIYLFYFENIYFLSMILLIIFLSFFQLLILKTLFNTKQNKKNNNYLNSNKKFTNYSAEFLNLINPIITNPNYLKITNKLHHLDQTIYEHSLKVAYLSYKIAKFMHIDPRNCVTAALLHDLYMNSWINDTSKKPLFKKHGFVHAREALDNSKIYFKPLLNYKIENAILRHMFPLNIIPPIYIEGWIVTISDKIISIMDIKTPIFIIALLGINRKTY